MILTSAFRILLLASGLSLGLAGTIAFAAEPKVRRNVEIEFEAIEGATKYEIQVVLKGSKRKPSRFMTKTPLWTATIKPGLYEMQIRTYDDRGVPGGWSPPTDLQVRLPAIIPVSPEPSETVKSAGAEKQNVKFKWEPVPDAGSYQIAVSSPTSGFKHEAVVETSEAEVELPAGENFTWNVTAVDRKNEKGEVSEQPYAFELRGPPLDRAKVEKPRSRYVREVKWRAPKYADSYSYELKVFDPTAKTWTSVETKTLNETRVPMDYSRPTGRYRAIVTAHGPRRDSSKPDQVDFFMRGGFKDPVEFDNAIMRDSITKPTNYYAIASYLITMMDYTFKNYDDNANVSFSALGGTGRVGLGYNHPESAWGGFGIVDMSGFVINGQNFQFASAEGHVTHRLEWGQSGLLLFGSGLFYKQLPIVSGSAEGGFTGVGKVSNIGPHAGFTYWLPVSDLMGVQLNARMYYTFMGSAAGGQKVDGSLSYQLGALGSYRLHRNWLGYAGYAYRIDQSVYQTRSGDPLSFAKPGQMNEISIGGHYLNLLLEWSF